MGKKKEKKGKKKKGAQEAAPTKSKKVFSNAPSRERHPDQVMRRMIQSSGPEMAVAHANQYGLQAELKKPYFIEAVARYERRKADRMVVRQASPTPETTESGDETQPQAE